MPNGIDLLLEDHRRVDELFAEFESTLDPTLVGQILCELTAHDDVEHAALYPMTGELLGDEALVLGMSAAHSDVKKQMEHLRAQEGSVLVAEVLGLRDLVKAHVADEERTLFPKLQKVASDEQLELLGARILACKQRVG